MKSLCILEADDHDIIRRGIPKRLRREWSTPDKSGGLNGSTQHQLEVYLQESQKLKSRSRALVQTEHYTVWF